jgi:hypothetical protein
MGLKTKNNAYRGGGGSSFVRNDHNLKSTIYGANPHDIPIFRRYLMFYISFRIVLCVPSYNIDIMIAVKQ